MAVAMVCATELQPLPKILGLVSLWFELSALAWAEIFLG